MNEYINITLDNIEKEHLCCAIGDPKHQNGVDKKKEWLKDQIKQGHVFRKLNAKGKVFIEFAPLDIAWVPINGHNFMYIYCLWVSGSYKGKGYAKELLTYAIEDAKKRGMNGICTITSKKKKPFLSEKSFFEKYNFRVVDSINDYELLSLSFNDSNPSFNTCVKQMKIDDQNLTIYYDNQCPYTENCIKEITEYLHENNIKINIYKVDTKEKAKNLPCIFNNWAVFKNGEFASNKLLNKNSLDKLLK